MLNYLSLRSRRILARPWVWTVFAVAAISVASASGPTFWRMESQIDFLQGDTDGVSVSSDGTLSLAPAEQLLTEATDPHFWAIALAPNGDVIIGSGNEGRIHRVDATGQSTVVADTEELQVHALTVDRNGNIYAGTSPRGVVYRIDTSGARDVFFDPEDRYIWDVAMDPNGNLIVATGDKAQIHRIRPNGESEILFTSEETHIVCLAVDRSGVIYAGTESNGLVLRIDTNGSTSVLFDTPLQEVRAIQVDTSGNVFAAALNGGNRIPSGGNVASSASTPASVSSGSTATVTVTTSATPMLLAEPASSPSSNGPTSGAIYRINPDGAADELWRSDRETPLSLSIATDDRLLVGTSEDGRVFMVNQNRSSSLLLSLEAEQVTDVLATSDGRTFLATSNPAKLYRLNRGRRTEGVYRSPPKDTETVSSWGKLRWDARLPGGSSLEFQTRSGNSAEPDNTWSDWSGSVADANGEQIQSPRGRFLQWRATLHSTGETSPELANVTAIYLQQNLAPAVTEITIHGPGQTFQKPIVTTGQMEILGMDGALPDAPGQNGSNGSSDPNNAAAINMSMMTRPTHRKGIQTVTWKASDPNRDELRYDVHYRAEGETLWRTLREGLTGAVIAWDTVAMPDGRYTLKVVASDAPGNPTELTRSGEKVSRSFEVDNTPPRVDSLTVTPGTAGHQIRFNAADDISPIRNVEYAVNSGAWHVVFPTDGIADSKEESYDFNLEGYGDGGVYTLVIKLTDNLGNTGTARSELR